MILPEFDVVSDYRLDHRWDYYQQVSLKLSEGAKQAHIQLRPRYSQNQSLSAIL